MSPSYDSYQELNIEWNQSAPSHWRPSRLKFDSYIKARVGWHGLKSDEFTEQGPFLITGSDFSGKVIDWSKCYHCDVERYEQDPYIQLKDNDLLITKDGTIGKVILTGKLPDKATLNSGVFVLRPLEERYDTKFYYWLMQSSVFHGFVEFYRTGSTIAHLYQETFCNLPYALPSLDEQNQIAAFLDRETAKIDQLIDKQQQLIKLLEEKRQAVISHAVTKGLNPDAPMKDSGVEWLGQVPEHWNIIPLRHFVQTTKGFAFKSSDFRDEGVVVARASDIKKQTLLQSGVYLPFEFIRSHAKVKLNKGDIVISTVGSNPDVINSAVGQLAIVPDELDGALLNQNTVILRPTNIASSLFLIQILSSTAYREHLDLHAHGTANQSSLSLEDILTFKAAIPPKEEQKLIYTEIKRISTRIDRLIDNATLSIRLMTERRTALISAAVTGKIDVRGQVQQDDEALAS